MITVLLWCDNNNNNTRTEFRVTWKERSHYLNQRPLVQPSWLKYVKTICISRSWYNHASKALGHVWVLQTTWTLKQKNTKWRSQEVHICRKMKGGYYHTCSGNRIKTNLRPCQCHGTPRLVEITRIVSKIQPQMLNIFAFFYFILRQANNM